MGTWLCAPATLHAPVATRHARAAAQAGEEASRAMASAVAEEELETLQGELVKARVGAGTRAECFRAHASRQDSTRLCLRVCIAE